MRSETLDRFEGRIRELAARAAAESDPGHDLAHIRRVVSAAIEIGRAEGGVAEIVVPAAWLHDVVTVPKSSPERPLASRRSAEAATAALREWGYPEPFLEPIRHAIAAHSFSAGIEPRTLEARIVQDADRLDALGAIGIARCFATAGSTGGALYCESDPFGASRPLDDRRWALDHFPRKLLTLAASMRTGTGARLARERTEFLRTYLDRLRAELPSGPAS